MLNYQRMMLHIEVAFITLIKKNHLCGSALVMKVALTFEPNHYLEDVQMLT